MNLKRLLLASALAAVVAFVWGFLSWTKLPWHDPLKFRDSEAVAKVIRENAPEHGIYMLPVGPESMSDEAGMKKYEEEIRTGPFVWAMVHPGVQDNSMVRGMGLSLLRGFVVALFVSLLLTRVSCGSFRSRVLFCMAIYLIGSLNSEAPFWIWFHGPLKNFLVMSADHVAEGFLVALVLAKFIRPAPGNTAP